MSSKSATRAAPFALGGAGAVATLLYVADAAESWTPAAREMLDGRAVRCRLTRLPGLLLGRWVGPDAAMLRRSFITFVARLRHAAAGLPARPPAGWSS